MTEKNDERKEGEMTEERPRGNVLREMTEEEKIKAIAGEQIFGEGVWEYIEERRGERVLHIGAIPPENAWQGRKEEALAAARVYSEIAAAFEDIREDLRHAREEIGELFWREPDAAKGQALACARGRLGDIGFLLSGILRDGEDGDDMDLDAPSLYRTIFREMVRLAERREGEETASSATKEETGEKHDREPREKGD